jgi:GT2 family glycosyltransferase
MIASTSTLSSRCTPAPKVVGKFIYVGHERFLVKGVSYGTFAPDDQGEQFPRLERVGQDFRMMRAYGVNTVRTYTPPPLEILDQAAEHGLRIIIGLPWAQHCAFLDDPKLCRLTRRDQAREIRRVSTHPAVLMTTLGNEIPAPVVRWHGGVRTERFLRELFEEAKAIAPEALFSYVNYPPTEYLDTSFFDICSFNVYLHREADMRLYLAHLQLVAGSRPLLLTELGADSLREGEEGQASLTAMQLRAAFTEGACGAVAFSWTDEWWRGGHPIKDWTFGLVDADRRPKLAAHAVSKVFEDAPFAEEGRRRWPKVSVVVCARNAASTLDDCLSSLQQLVYPDVDLVLVNDGSTDATGAIARRYASVKVIDVARGGLSAARNVGIANAPGEIIAFTDADVRVDPHWLTYLVQPFLNSDVVAAGGPNVIPPDDPWFAQCIARSPGGPTHVLLDDRIAEHVPGCNMAFRRDALLAVGGFNPIYVRAGDDVDVCWRCQMLGHRIGFAPAALVWHHHRSSLRAYWRQQVGYGEAESWLYAHHPDKFRDGRMRWGGRIYSPLPFVQSISAVQINSGIWGTDPFPSVYRTDSSPVLFLPHLARWQAISFLLLLLGVLMSPRSPGILMMVAGLLGLTATGVKCFMYALRTDVGVLSDVSRFSPAVNRFASRIAIAMLHAVQPMARAWGRLRGMIVPPRDLEADQSRVWPEQAGVPSWRQLVGALKLMAGRNHQVDYWSEHWVDRVELLRQVTSRLHQGTARLVEIDDGWQTNWDVRVGIGRWAYLPLRALVEDHEAGRCLFRAAFSLRFTPFAMVMSAVSAIGGAGLSMAGIPHFAVGALGLSGAAGLAAAWRIAVCVADTKRSIDIAAMESGLDVLDPVKARRATHPQPSLALISSGIEFHDVKRRRMAASTWRTPSRRPHTKAGGWLREAERRGMPQTLAVSTEAERKLGSGRAKLDA